MSKNEETYMMLMTHKESGQQFQHIFNGEEAATEAYETTKEAISNPEMYQAEFVSGLGIYSFNPKDFSDVMLCTAEALHNFREYQAMNNVALQLAANRKAQGGGGSIIPARFAEAAVKPNGKG